MVDHILCSLAWVVVPWVLLCATSKIRGITIALCTPTGSPVLGLLVRALTAACRSASSQKKVTGPEEIGRNRGEKTGMSHTVKTSQEP